MKPPSAHSVRRGRRPGLALLTAAAGSYAANCALGTAVATRRIDTSNVRWVHHLLYVCTSVFTGAALAALVRVGSPAGRALAPAAVPLAVIPFGGSRSRRHMAIALSAAPFYLVSLVRAWR